MDDKKAVDNVKKVLKNVSEKFVVYEITATSENVAVQPDGKVKATFDIPEGYDPAKVIVVYVSDDGSTELVPSTVNADGKTIAAELSHFSKYVVAETKDDADINTIGAEDDKNSGNAWVWIVITVVVLGAVAAWYFLYYKKAK